MGPMVSARESRITWEEYGGDLPGERPSPDGVRQARTDEIAWARDQ